jgi:hypothetical protein
MFRSLGFGTSFIISWYRTFLEKLTVAQPVTKFPALWIAKFQLRFPKTYRIPLGFQSEEQFIIKS